MVGIFLHALYNPGRVVSFVGTAHDQSRQPFCGLDLWATFKRWQDFSCPDTRWRARLKLMRKQAGNNFWPGNTLISPDVDQISHLSLQKLRFLLLDLVNSPRLSQILFI